MTGSSNGKRTTLATAGRVVFLLSLVVGVALAAIAVWGVLEVRSQEAAQGPDVALVGYQGAVTMTKGAERRISVDGPSLRTAQCTVTAPDGGVQTLEGVDLVRRDVPLGKHGLGDVRAEVSGEHRVECSGVREAWVSDEFDPLRRSLLAVPALAGAFLVVAVIPVGVVSLLVWRMAERRRG